MSDVININARKPPVVYTVTIAHHWDDTLEFRIEDVADDERSRDAVMSAFRRISGADAEIEKLTSDLRLAIWADSGECEELTVQNIKLRAERDALRALLREARNFMPFYTEELRARIDASLKESKP